MVGEKLCRTLEIRGDLMIGRVTLAKLKTNRVQGTAGGLKVGFYLTPISL